MTPHNRMILAAFAIFNRGCEVWYFTSYVAATVPRVSSKIVPTCNLINIAHNILQMNWSTGLIFIEGWKQKRIVCQRLNEWRFMCVHELPFWVWCVKKTCILNSLLDIVVYCVGVAPGATCVGALKFNFDNCIQHLSHFRWNVSSVNVDHVTL